MQTARSTTQGISLSASYLERDIDPADVYQST